MKAVVTDIEGTTTSLAFVRDVLFPYARRRLPVWLVAHKRHPEVAAHIEAVRAEARVGTLAEVAATLIGWIDADRKATSLKALQGLVWEEGYRDGTLRSHVYADVPTALRGWREAGLTLAVYSSGSIQAQKLLFAHTDAGDLTPSFTTYFDTATGPKLEESSYRTIAEALGFAASDVLFLSDAVEELDAAAAAGMATIQVVRDGALDPGARHRQVESFADIRL